MSCHEGRAEERGESSAGAPEVLDALSSILISSSPSSGAQIGESVIEDCGPGLDNQRSPWRGGGVPVVSRDTRQ